MNINMSDFFKNNISSGSLTTDVNVSENVSHESSGSNNAVQAAGTVSYTHLTLPTKA